jgi:copper chaperone CopZ
MYSEIFVENIKCFGCRNTVIKEVKKQEMVQSVDVEVETGKVSLNYQGGEETLARIKSRLYRKGYPEKGSNNIKSTAKSYVSCALGRLGGPERYQVKQYDIAED